jgi:hypothetical protein
LFGYRLVTAGGPVIRINFSISARFAGARLSLAAGDIKTQVITANVIRVLSIASLLSG